MITVLMTSAQSTWYQVSTNTTKKLNTIDFPTPQVGYIGGNDSLLLKTTDGGTTWNEVSFTGINFFAGGEHFLRLDFVTADIGFATVGPYSGAYKTTDGGLTWTQLTTTGSLCYNHGLYFLDDGYGFVGGSGCFQGENMDKFVGGVSSPVTINTPSWDAMDMIVDIDFDMNQFGSYGLAVSSGGRILRTTDSGDTWDTIPSGLGNGIPLTSVTIVNDTLAYAGYDDLGGGFGLLMTTDAGLTWAMDMNSATFYYPAFHDVHTAGNGIIYAGAQPSSVENGLIFESNSGGVWYAHAADQIIYNMTSYSDSIVWGVGDSGYVVTNVPPASLGISDDYFEINSMDVYPNPTNTTLNIVLPVGVSESGIQLIIRDLSGRIIMETFGEKQLDVSGLVPGIYLAELQSNGKTYSNKFMVSQ